MICLVSSRFPFDGHSLAPHSFYRHLQSPFFRECKSFGEGRIQSSRISDNHKSGFFSFNCGLGRQHCLSGFYICKLGSDQSYRAVKLVLGRISVSKIQCAGHLGSSSCVLGSRRRRFCRVQMMAGGGCGSNASIGASYGTDQGDASRPSNDVMDTTRSVSVTTVGKSTNIAWHECSVKREERQKLLGQKGCVIWITGLSGSGKSTLACTLDHALLKRGNLSYVIDGDNVRHGLNKNLGFCVEDRSENIRRVGEVAKLFVDAGIICIASVISPYRRDREACRQLVDAGEFIEVYMDFPLRLCEERDPKGLYKLARAGKIKGFTGVDDPYEAPLSCEVVMEPIDGRCPTPSEMAAQLICYLEEKGFLGFPSEVPPLAPYMTHGQCENLSK